MAARRGGGWVGRREFGRGSGLGAAGAVGGPGAWVGEGCRAFIADSATNAKHPWEMVVRIASDQHGVVAAWQLVAAGISRDTIHRWCRSGRLNRVHQGVYTLLTQPLTRK